MKYESPKTKQVLRYHIISLAKNLSCYVASAIQCDSECFTIYSQNKRTNRDLALSTDAENAMNGT